MRPCAAATTSIAFALLGCQKNSQPRAIKPLPVAPPAEVVVEKQQQMKFAQPQSRHPAREGKPPLVYLLESPAQVQIVDAQDGAVIAQATLAAHSIISVDASRGVRSGQQELAPGPLSGQHVYQIFVTTGTENIYRTDLIQPGKEN